LEIFLPPELEAFVNELVGSDIYPTESEVIVHALWLLETQHRADRAQLEHLRAEIQIGIDQCERGEVAELDVEEIIREGQRRLARRLTKEKARSA
jgi:antitoxin ParD1/3/4